MGYIHFKWKVVEIFWAVCKRGVPILNKRMPSTAKEDFIQNISLNDREVWMKTFPKKIVPNSELYAINYPYTKRFLISKEHMYF